MATLRISLLGPFRVERDGQVIPRHEWARPKDRALLKLLALDRGHLLPQDRLLDALWPDLEPASAANSLHASVSRLRELLDPTPLIRRDAAGYTLAATDAVRVDVEVFRRLLGQGRDGRRRGAWAPAARAYRAAAALCRGEPPARGRGYSATAAGRRLPSRVCTFYCTAEHGETAERPALFSAVNPVPLARL